MSGTEAQDPVAAPASKPAPGPLKVVKGLVVRLAAFGLLYWVIDAHGGWQLVMSVVDRLRNTWPLLLLPWLVGVVLTILAYRNNLPQRGVAVPWYVMIQIERSGSALNQLLPFGNSSSNIVKVALLRHWYSLEAIVAAGVWGGLGTGACNAVAALGPLMAIGGSYADGLLLWALVALNVAMSIPALTILSLVGKGLSERMTHLLTRLPMAIVRRRRQAWLAWAARLDTHLKSAVGDRRADFMRLIRIRILSQAVRVGEIWLAVELLGLPGGIFTALVYNSGSRAVTQLLAFVPGRLGVMELTMTGVFAALGLAPEAGLELVLALRLRYIANLLLSFGALSSTYALAEKYPPKGVAT